MIAEMMSESSHDALAPRHTLADTHTHATHMVAFVWAALHGARFAESVQGTQMCAQF